MVDYAYVGPQKELARAGSTTWVLVETKLLRKYIGTGTREIAQWVGHLPYTWLTWYYIGSIKPFSPPRLSGIK